MHPRLLVSNFAECFRFYRDVMGFKVTWEDDNYASFTDGERNEAAFALFRRQMMAAVVGTANLPSESVCQDRTALIFEVEDIDQTFEKLSGQGVQFVAGPEDHPDWGIRSAYLRDPDGNLIELNSGLEESKHSESLREASRKQRAE